MILLINFRNWAKNYWLFVEIFPRFVKTALYLSKGSSWRKLLFSDKVCFVYHFHIMSGKFSAFWQKFVDRVVKIAFYVPIGKLNWEKVFFGKKTWYFLHPFRTWNESFRLSFDTFPCRIVSIAYYLSIEAFWVERNFIGKNGFPDQLPKLSNKLLAYSRNFSKNCRNGALFVQRIKLTKTSFSEEVCFVYLFQIMSGNFSSFWQKFVDRVVKIAFYVTVGKLGWEIVLFGKKNLILSSSYSDKERIFFVCHSKLFPAELSQLHTNCPWKHSE